MATAEQTQVGYCILSQQGLVLTRTLLHFVIFVTSQLWKHIRILHRFSIFCQLTKKNQCGWEKQGTCNINDEVKRHLGKPVQLHGMLQDAKVHEVCSYPALQGSWIEHDSLLCWGRSGSAFVSWAAQVISAHKLSRTCSSPSKNLARAATSHSRFQTCPRPTFSSLILGLEMLVLHSWSESALSTWLFSFPICTFLTLLTTPLIA